MIFRLFIEPTSSTYAYLLADQETRNALLIDPVREDFERYQKIIKELNLTLSYVLETHLHADHVTCGSLLRKEFGAKLAVSKETGVVNADIYLNHFDTIHVGKLKIQAFYTPGHTDGDMCYLWENHIFTGDVLHFRGCGRTDFQNGSSEKLFYSIKDILYKLPPETIIHPGHDYRGNTTSTILEEKEYNPRINDRTTLTEFKTTMSKLKLDYPKNIDVSLPRNKFSGELS